MTIVMPYKEYCDSLEHPMLTLESHTDHMGPILSYREHLMLRSHRVTM
ncbi:unnamed protein product [Chironomus riparius]|uniref:Uncharacterized protein n=1 Tax=Chironomus riparius TaxID=315576 RepID=A0A9N9WYJ0_9DIPT|nr:unnamed protein product [Chironomus riparius]